LEDIGGGGGCSLSTGCAAVGSIYSLGGLVMWILNKKVIKVKYFIPSLAK
jgi:hypothetical protein